jgi:hypothetical protein
VALPLDGGYSAGSSDGHRISSLEHARHLVVDLIVSDASDDFVYQIEDLPKQVLKRLDAVVLIRDSH